MSFANLLIHRCEVLRRGGGVNRMGEPNDRWESVETGIPCRLNRTLGGQRDTERMRETYDVTHEMFILPGSTTLREDDDVTVTDADGTELIAHARVVLMRAAFAGKPGVHHVEVFLSHLRGPQSA